MFEKCIDMKERRVYYSDKGFRTCVLQIGGLEMDYKHITMQMLRKIKNEGAWKKIYTLVKVLLEQQGD